MRQPATDTGCAFDTVDGCIALSDHLEEEWSRFGDEVIEWRVIDTATGEQVWRYTHEGIQA